jgi:hypothetical protein
MNVIKATSVPTLLQINQTKTPECIYCCAGIDFDNKQNLIKMKAGKINNVNGKFLKFYATYILKF